MSIERCLFCGEPTGRAGEGNDSLYDDQGEGPYCESCWDDHERDVAQQEYDLQAEQHRQWNRLTDQERWARIKNVLH